MIFVWVLLILVLVFAAGLYVVYDSCFSNNRKFMGKETDYPGDEASAPYREGVLRCVEQVMAEPCEEVSVYSHDGYLLRGRYYHRREGAPLTIFFHGYRSTSRRDGNGIFFYTKQWGQNILLVDQRAHGISEGKTITFGILERYDCFSWTEWALQRFGNDQQIILSGLSMGGATVLMTAGMGLPRQVKGIYADCPFSSPKDVIRKVIADLHFPVEPVYALAKLGAKWIGGFDLEETTALEAVKNATVPVLIIHGDKDTFVPCQMSQACKVAGQDMVELLLVEGAGHGMSQVMKPKLYEDTVFAFYKKVLGD